MTVVMAVDTIPKQYIRAYESVEAQGFRKVYIIAGVSLFYHTTTPSDSIEHPYFD